MKLKDCRYPVILQPNKVPELNVIRKCVKGLIIGAAVTIDKLENELNQLIDNNTLGILLQYYNIS